MKTRWLKLFGVFILIVNSGLLLSSCVQSEASPTAPPSPTATSVLESYQEQTGGETDAEIQMILDELTGLPLAEFFEQSFLQLSLRYPESLVELGIDELLGVDGAALDDWSLEFQQATTQLEAGILEILLDFDYDTLSEGQRVSYNVYQWYLEDLLVMDQYADYHYIASFMILNSVHNQTFQFFTYTHPVTSLQQAENYIARLNQLDEKYGQLVDALQRRADKGLIPPQFSIDWALYGLRRQTSSVAISHPFYGAFREKLNQIDELTDDQRDALLDEAEEAINNSVLPAYQELIAELERQRSLASDENMGLWQFEDGEDYYQALLRHYTTTDLSADEIHQLGLEQLERIHAEMREIFDQLGYPEDEDLASLYQRVAVDSGTIPASQAAERYEAIIADAYQRLDQAFEIAPQAEVIVIGGSEGDYYTRGSLDGSRPGAFNVIIQGGSEPTYEMNTLAYHETIPGHHFQIELAREMDLPSFQREIGTLGYTEGWALYAERLAFDLGWYADDPYGNLGRLQDEALRAARLVVDTGLHTQQWGFDQAVEFLYENVGWSRDDCEIQIARYIVLPGQATAYMVGMLQILDLRQQATDRLGDDFDLAEFHTVILDGGAMPLSLLTEKVEAYIDSKSTE